MKTATVLFALEFVDDEFKHRREAVSKDQLLEIMAREEQEIAGRTK